MFSSRLLSVQIKVPSEHGPVADCSYTNTNRESWLKRGENLLRVVKTFFVLIIIKWVN